MKSKFLLIGTGLITLMLVYNVMLSRRQGAPSGRVGDPSTEQTCFNGCHMGSDLNSGPGTPLITSNIPMEGYEPDSTYTITARMQQTGITRFGFQVLPFGSTSSDGVGEVTLTDDTRTRIMAEGAKQYVTHTSASTDSTGSNTWMFDWKAPSAGSGEVVFYSAFVAANANNNNQGDLVYAVSDTVQEAVSTSRFSDLTANLRILASDGIIQIDMDLLAATSLEIKALDLSGRTLFQQKQSANSGRFSKEISTQGWSTGIYVIALRHDRGFTHDKVWVY